MNFFAASGFLALALIANPGDAAPARYGWGPLMPGTGAISKSRSGFPFRMGETSHGPAGIIAARPAVNSSRT